MLMPFRLAVAIVRRANRTVLDEGYYTNAITRMHDMITWFFLDRNEGSKLSYRAFIEVILSVHVATGIDPDEIDKIVA